MKLLAVFGAGLLFTGAASATTLLTEGFDDISTLLSLGWVLTNNSAPLGTTDWFQGNPGVFPSQSGAPDSYIAANFENAAAGGNISNWLITPLLGLIDGTAVSFYTRSAGAFPDRLEVRVNPLGTTNVGGTDTSVGDFTLLLASINPGLVDGGYPTDWTSFTIVVNGLPVLTDARIALRYTVPDTLTNGDYIGIDSLQVISDIPEPAALLMLGTGLSALLLARRRRCRQ